MSQTDEEREMRMQTPETRNGAFMGKKREWGIILKNGFCYTYGLDVLLYLAGF